MTDIPESLKLLVLGGAAGILSGMFGIYSSPVISCSRPISSRNAPSPSKSLRPRGTFRPRPDRFQFGSGGPLPARLVLVDRPNESVRVA
jgi:hypothetical protein